jgi:uncharacterized protein (TIGR02001 family)
MNKISKNLLVSPLVLAVTLAAHSAVAEFSGNIGVHSKYVLRGIAIENDNAAIQGGLDWSNDGGFYAGWWFSSLGYSYDNTTGVKTGNGFENDFYGGYVLNISDSLSVDLGLTQYLYMNVDDSNLTEANLSVGVGDFYAKMQYLLSDGWWGNSGDIYWTAGYSFGLPKNFGLALDLGYYTYDDNDTPKYGVTTTSSSGFRNFTTTLSYPIGKSGAEAYVQYVVAGEDRMSNDTYDDQVVAGLTYAFDL